MPLLQVECTSQLKQWLTLEGSYGERQAVGTRHPAVLVWSLPWLFHETLPECEAKEETPLGEDEKVPEDADHLDSAVPHAWHVSPM